MASRPRKLAIPSTALVVAKPWRCCKETEEERYISVLDLCDLQEDRKNTIRQRYLPLLHDFTKRAYYYMLLFHIGHLIITVGSLIVPALLSVQYTTSLSAYQNNI